MDKRALLYTLGFMLALVCLSYVSAESSYVFKQGEIIDLKIPVYDDTNAPATNAISCNLNVVSPNQTVIVDSQAMTFNTGGIFSYQIPAMTELGEYSCSMACTNGTVNGFSTFAFDVTPTGEKYDITQIGIIIAQGILIALFMVLGFSFSKEKWKLRGFFFVLALFIGVLAINSLRVLTGSSQILNTMTNSAFIIGRVAVSFMAIYLLIYYTIELFKNLKNKKEMKWEVSNRFS